MITLKEVNLNHYAIILEKSFDFESHKEFRELMKQAVSHKPAELSIDFGRVEYIDSSALGMLMLAKHETDAISCEVTLTNLRDGHAKNVLSLVKFDQIFKIES